VALISGILWFNALTILVPGVMSRVIGPDFPNPWFISLGPIGAILAFAYIGACFFLGMFLGVWTSGLLWWIGLKTIEGLKISMARTRGSSTHADDDLGS
jgi:hypothetical protein